MVMMRQVDRWYAYAYPLAACRRLYTAVPINVRGLACVDRAPLGGGMTPFWLASLSRR